MLKKERQNYLYPFFIYLIRRLYGFRLIFFVFCYFIPVLVSSQPPSLKFEHVTTVDGLSHNKVQCILQDKHSYIWFGTVYGLNRYDGYTFKVFESIPGDSLTLPNNDIICLYQDHDDYIWIGTSTSSFACYDPHTETFHTYILPAPQAWVHDFKEDENGLLWLATSAGLFSFNKQTHNTKYHVTDSSARENIQGILKEQNKNILWLSSETGIRKFNKKTESVKTYPVPYPAFLDISGEITHNVIEDRRGNIWMSTSDLGVQQLDPQKEKLTSYPVNILNPSSSKSKVITQIMEDTDGKIWICGEGLAILDPLTRSFFPYKMDVDDPLGIPGKIRAILKDKSGIYWLGTERGIAKYDPRLYSFTTVKPHPPYTLETANTVLEDEDHKFWIGNYIGLGSMDPNTGIYKNENEILKTKEITPLFSSLYNRDKSMWFGSEGCLFRVYKVKGYGTFFSEKILLPGAGKVSVTALSQDSKGIVWIGTKRGGLFFYDPSLKTLKMYGGVEKEGDMFSACTISVLHAISADSIIIGTEGMGLILLRPTAGKFQKIMLQKNENTTSPEYSIMNAICEDHKKNIWIGTENDGLWQTDVSFSKFRNYTVKDGLQCMNISQIVDDSQGQIWLNTNLGLETIEPAKNRYVHYSEKDGLNINQAAYLIKKSSGDLLRIDFNGLHIFHSFSTNLNKDVPPVYINYLQVPDKSIPIYNDTTIHLAYDQNYVSFEYVALNYTQSFKNRYAIKFGGIDKKWIDVGSRRFASYSNLGAGKYLFRVKACNNNGIWNETGAKLTLIISPPWWHTWWFYASCFAIVTAAVYAFFRYRLQQKIKAFEVRNSISQDLHDEVGSTLSSIRFLSSMELDDANSNKERAQTTLISINESSNKMLEAMNDIIWNIQPQNDTLENIVARMMSFASELLEAQKITLYFTVSDTVKHLRLGLKVRYDFFVIFKEAVNNLAKYSAASTASINLEFLHPYVSLTIGDNGKGFDYQNIKKGNGLKNMESRAKKIGAIYSLQTAPGNGTVISIQVKPT